MSAMETLVETIKRVLLNEPRYRQKQVFEAIYQNGVKDFSEITALPIYLREMLSQNVEKIEKLEPVTKSVSDQAEKVLFKTSDGQNIESVLMKYKEDSGKFRNALCVSSQVGCALGCTFCATGAVGFKKNLTPDEIVDQILYFKRLGISIDNVFFSGMGEPFSNPELFSALNIITSPEFLGMGARKISISTVGIIPGIERLAKEYPQINLAFSLHSPFETERAEIMPVTKAYPVAKVFQTLNKHLAQNKRKVFIAYILLGGFNDDSSRAIELVKLIKSQGTSSYLYHINLIRFHPGVIKGKFLEPTEKSVNKFFSIIKRSGLSCTIRQDFGIGIDAACGQLKAKYEKSIPAVVKAN